MRFPLVFIQSLLLILWYAVPSFAAVPWWVIFLPALVPAVVLGSMAVFGLVALVIAALVAVFQN